MPENLVFSKPCLLGLQMAFSYAKNLLVSLPLLSDLLSHFTRVQLFVTLWTLAHQALLSMEFSRQEYWSGLPCPPSGDLSNRRIESTSLMSPALADRFFNMCHLGRLYSSYKDTNLLDWNLTLTSSLTLINTLKALSPNIVALRVRII